MERKVSEQLSEKLIEENFRPAFGEVINAFSIPILRGRIEELDLEQARLDSRKWVETAKRRHGEDNGKNYTTYFDQDLRDELPRTDWGRQFVNIMKDTYVKWCAEVFGHDVDYLTRHDIHCFTWISVYNTPHQHDVHNHVNSLMSGTFYITADPQDSQPIKFFSPAMMSNFSHRVIPQNYEDHHDPQIRWTGSGMTQDEMFFHPASGDFLLWPSYLQHMVPPTSFDRPADYERIALSFNLLHHPLMADNNTGDQFPYSFIQKEQPPHE